MVYSFQRKSSRQFLHPNLYVGVTYGQVSLHSGQSLTNMRSLGAKATATVCEPFRCLSRTLRRAALLLKADARQTDFS